MSKVKIYITPKKNLIGVRIRDGYCEKFIENQVTYNGLIDGRIFHINPELEYWLINEEIVYEGPDFIQSTITFKCTQEQFIMFKMRWM